jgi:uncharacterized protein (DUF433 family)
MSHLNEAAQWLERLNRAEKAQLMQWIARDPADAYPGIDHDPRINGGEACIVRTRIPVWLLIQARERGFSEADLLASYPTLKVEDLANAWAYARAHRDEIQRDIDGNDT